MRKLNDALALKWARLSPRFLPFADAASPELPLPRLLRLSLFQFSVAMAIVLLNGTLNRVMIVEMGVPSSIVALMVSLPLLFAPFRALVGFRSDHHRSALGWRRVPYIWIGSMLQFGGLAIMPFALIILSGDTNGPVWIGHLAASLAFLLVGAGLHTTQTAGLALATDIAPEDSRPRVVAFLYVMMLIGMVASSLVFGALLAKFSQIRLIQVIQGAAAVTMIFNIIALWKQEARDPSRTASSSEEPLFRDAWAALHSGGKSSRVLISVGLGSAAFSMQDILLEPYGGEILHMSVGATTSLTGLQVFGTLVGLFIAARQLARDADPYRLAGYGVAVGLMGFPAIILAGPAESAAMLRFGTLLIGFGGGLFSVGTLTAAMTRAAGGQSGLALGVWGAVQASASGIAIAFGGALRDAIAHAAEAGALGSTLASSMTGYSAVYHIELLLLLATLVAIGPLVRSTRSGEPPVTQKFGLAEFPG